MMNVLASALCLAAGASASVFRGWSNSSFILTTPQVTSTEDVKVKETGSGSFHLMSATPKYPYDGSTVSTCTYWYDNEDGSLTCDLMPLIWGITEDEWNRWNPSVGTDCSGFATGKSYCVEATESPTTTGSVPTPTDGTGNGIETPTPTQPGMVDNCNAFYYVSTGETCDGITSKNGITFANLLEWNTGIGSDCSGLWAKTNVCAGIIGGTPTDPGNGIATPTPIIDGMVDNCTVFHYVETGQTCSAIIAKYGITLELFAKWNPAVGSDCSGMWAKTYACVSTTDYESTPTDPGNGQSTTLAKDMYSGSSGEGWSSGNQDAFSHYMGQVLNGWGLLIDKTLDTLFNGTDGNIERSHSMIVDAKMYPGKPTADEEPEINLNNTLITSVQKTFYAYSIPALWRISEGSAFIMNSGSSCVDGNPISDYVDDKTEKAARVCYEDTLYYLVYPKGLAWECMDDGSCIDSKFQAPPGLESLGDFGDLTIDDFVIGSINTWEISGNEGDRTVVDTPSDDTMRKLTDIDIRVAGYLHLPVCTVARARKSWETSESGKSDNYPCDPPVGQDYCGESTFEDKTSLDASPTIADCQTIIKNIEDDGSTSWTQIVAGKPHRRILQFSSCAFGIEANEQRKNADFRVGGQDVIDIINTSISKFGKEGRIGARGEMSCQGSSTGQGVTWGLYHND